MEVEIKNENIYCMNIFPYKVKKTLMALRSRYKHAIFTIGEPMYFPGSYPLDIMKICKMVGIYINIPDMEKFLMEDHPEGYMKEDRFHLLINAQIS